MFILFDVVRIGFEVMYWLVIVRVILSWIRHDPYHPIIRFIYESTEVILGPIRRIMPRGGMGIDFSPIIAILLLRVLQSAVLNTLATLLY